VFVTTVPNDWQASVIVVGVIVCGLVLILSMRPVRSRLPRVRLDRRGPGNGFAIQFHPPAAQGRRRVRQESFVLAKDIHEFLRDQPAPYLSSLADHQAMVTGMNAANTDEEKQAVWNQFTARETERWTHENQELAARFGGRLHYLIGEYRRRGMLTDSEASKLAWECSSSGWLAQAASELEALGRRL
jgi:hypothetical protein